MLQRKKGRDAMLFQLGNVYSTRGIADLKETIGGFEGFVIDCIYRHSQGDWGELCAEDKEYNNEAVKSGNRLLSAYVHTPTGTKVWVITEADRSATTVLLPDEY